MPTTITDRYANMAYLEVTESAANTITFEELKTGVGIFEKVALIIHRIEYMISQASRNLLVAVDDSVYAAWVTSNQITSVLKDKPQCLDNVRLSIAVHGAAATASECTDPIIHDFTSLPGGGLIVPSSTLYLACQGVSLGGAITARSSLYFSYKAVKPEEYWELVEATRALT